MNPADRPADDSAGAPADHPAGQSAAHPAGGPARDPVAVALEGLPVTFRPIVTRVVLLTMGALLLSALTTVALLMPHDGAAPWSPVERATVIATGVVFCAVLAVLSRPKAVADADGLTVVNLMTRRRLAWPEVLRVNLGSGDAWVRLDLADGTSLAVMGIQPGIARQSALRDARRLHFLAEALGEARGTADA